MTNYRRGTVTAESNWVEWLTRSYAQDPVVARRGRVTAALLLVVGAAALVILLVRLLVGEATAFMTGISLLVGLGVMGGLFAANRRGHTAEAGLILSLTLLLANFRLFDLSERGLPGPGILIVPILVAGIVGPAISSVGVALLAMFGHLMVNLQANPDYFNTLGPEVAGLLNLYGQFFAVAIASWLFARTSNQALQESTTYSLTLAHQQELLEERVATQSRYLQATTTIARAIVGMRDLDHLLDEVVKLIQTTFGYYHVQVFLVDEDREFAVLRQSTGEAGQALLARGHRLPVGSLSVIGQVTARGRSVIARDTDTDSIHRRNELLPLTRSEMALPLVAGDRMIGALDLQSVEADAFSEEVMPTLQALADQLAIAIENARLYNQTQESLRELQELYSEVTERSWADFLASARETERRQSYGPETKGVEEQRSAIIKRVLGAGTVIVSSGKDGRAAFIAAPIIVRNEVVGVIGVEPDQPRDWTQDDLQLIQSIAERAGLAVENARLYIQAQRAADRERLVNTIASRLQRAPNLTLLLESAAQELASALGTENVYAEISLDHPLARPRRQVSATTEPVEGEAKPTEEPLPAPENGRPNIAPDQVRQDKPDESEQARAKR